MGAAKYAKGEDIARNYAQAAYQHTTEGWLSELSTVQDRLGDDPALLADLNNTELSFAERQARLRALLPPDTRIDVKNFLYLLLREGHLGLLNPGVAAGWTERPNLGTSLRLFQPSHNLGRRRPTRQGNRSGASRSGLNPRRHCTPIPNHILADSVVAVYHGSWAYSLRATNHWG